MNNRDIKLHDFQKIILKKLAATSSTRFNNLLIEGLESEHMNYHLKKLIELGFVKKIEDQYSLTDNGKDYTNLMDDEVEFIEKQPKTSVLLNVVRKNSNGEIEYLLARRLRQPYLGKVGKPTGKVRFGETLKEAASRELYEETGLRAQTIVLEKIYHKMRYKVNKVYVQDVIFYQFFMKDLSGSFISKTQHQENLWVSADDLKNNKDIDPFDDLKLLDIFEPQDLIFLEDNALAEGY